MVASINGSARRLFAGEVESLLTIPRGVSDLIEKRPQEELASRQCRRHSLLAPTVPISVLTFASQALLVHSVAADMTRDYNLDIDPATLGPAWARAPFLDTPECLGLHLTSRVGPDSCERKRSVSHSWQNRYRAVSLQGDRFQ